MWARYPSVIDLRHVFGSKKKETEKGSISPTKSLVLTFLIVSHRTRLCNRIEKACQYLNAFRLFFSQLLCNPFEIWFWGDISLNPTEQGQQISTGMYSDGQMVSSDPKIENKTKTSQLVSSWSISHLRNELSSGMLMILLHGLIENFLTTTSDINYEQEKIDTAFNSDSLKTDLRVKQGHLNPSPLAPWVASAWVHINPILLHRQRKTREDACDSEESGWNITLTSYATIGRPNRNMPTPFHHQWWPLQGLWPNIMIQVIEPGSIRRGHH